MNIDFTLLEHPITPDELAEFRTQEIQSNVTLPPNLDGGRLELSLLYRQKWDAAWENFARIKKFAAVNNFTFLTRTINFHYPGMMAENSARGTQTLYNCVRPVEHPRCEWGNYDWFGEPNNPKSHVHFGYIAIELGRSMPHMILDSRRNNVKSFGIEESRIKAQFSSDQRINLEGDFANHFTLYAPQQYKTDAYYIFTPDFMAELVDEAGDFDVEIIDNYMILYRTSPFTQYTPELVDKILRIISIVGAKAQLRSDRYRDERHIDAAIQEVSPSVAPEGRRLAPSTAMYKIAAAALWAFALYILVTAAIRLIDAVY